MMEYSIHRAANTSLPYDDNYILMYLEQLGVLLVIGMMETHKLMYLQFNLSDHHYYDDERTSSYWSENLRW